MAQTKPALLVLALPLSFAALVFACGTESDPIPGADKDGGNGVGTQEPGGGDARGAVEGGSPTVDAGFDADAALVCPDSNPEGVADDCRRAPEESTTCRSQRRFEHHCTSPDGGPTARPHTFGGNTVACNPLNGDRNKPTWCCASACVRVRALDCSDCQGKEYFQCSGVFDRPSYCTIPPAIQPPVIDGAQRTVNLCCEPQ
ncbi:MAG: hypothetical protein KF894_29605 [Labilithrix sp.]|nr:hypothetical protein [Labilithrix sp.]